MTQVIDGKVVEMKFDNSDFEKNVAQSMSTLDKLKQALNFDSAKSLENVSKASKNFDMSGVGTAVETVQAKFSALQVIGMTALSELTKAAMHFGANVISSVVEPIKSGGMNRALNIEQAKFQLEGLHVAWKDIEGDIDYAVSGTAYGMDAAAKAASQLTASGVQTGQQMKEALRGISGVAAMTSSSYEEISPIFTTVAGQGKLMTMQLRQLESRGLNAASTLAKALNVTEAEVRQMVTDGKIDFETFAWAMDDAFGEHAKDANKTFTGAMSNVKAALSRIGQGFAEPYMENMRLIAVQSIQVLNGIKKAMGPIYEIVSSIMEKVQGKITGFLSHVTLKESYTNIIDGFINGFYALLGVLIPVKDAFKSIFPKDFVWILRDASRAFKDFTEKLLISDETADKIKRTFKGVFAVFDILGMAIKALFETIKPFTGGLGDILSDVLDFSGGMGDYLVNLRNSIKANNTFGEAFAKAADVIANAGTKIKEVFNKIVEAIKEFKSSHFDNLDFSGFTNFIDSIKEKLPTFDSVGEAFKAVFEKIKTVFSNVAPVIKAGVKIITDSIGQLLNGFADAFKGSGNDPFTTFLNIFSTTTVGAMFVSFAQALAQVKKQVQNMGGLSSVLFEVKNTLKTFQADLKADVLTKLAKAIAIFAASIFILSLINPGKLMASMVAVEVLIETLKKFLLAIEGMTKSAGMFDAAKMYALGGVMISLGMAVLVLALAIKVLSKIEFLDLIKGVGTVVILIKVLADQAVLLSNIDTKVMKGAKTMIALAIAVRILASAVKAMSSMSLGELIKGLGATVILIYALTGAIKLLDDTKVKGAAAAFLGLSVGLLILTQAVKQLAQIPLEQLVQGMAAAVIGIMAMSLALALIGVTAKGGTLAAAAVALIALAAALMIFTASVEKLAALPLEQLVQGVAAAVIGIMSMALALAMLATIAKPAKLLAASAAMLIMSVSLNLIAAAIKTLGEMKMEDLLKGFITLAATIALFAVAATALTPILPVMAALAGVIALLGVGVLALGLGVAALSLGLMTLATACTTVVANLGAILMIIATIIPAIATALANGIIQFVVVIGNGAAQIVSAVVSLCHEILQGLSTLLPDIFQFVITLLIQFIDAIVVLVPYLVEAGMKLIIGLYDGIARQMPELVRASNDLFINFINSLADGIRRDTPRIIEATDNLMNAMIEAMVMWFTHFDEKGGEIVDKIIEGIKKTWETIKSVGKELVDLAGKGIEEGIANIVQLGKDLVDGFIKGIKEAPGKVWDAACSVANNALNAIAETQDSHSAAKEGIKLGGYLPEGYGIGISDGREDVQGAAEAVADSAVSEFENAQERIKGIRADMEKDRTWYQKVKSEYQKSTQTDTKLNKELREEHFKVKKAEDDVVKSTENLTEAQEGLAKSTGKSSKAAKEQKDIFEKIKDSITSSIDIFSKFETKTELTGKQLLENMKSNIDGVASWTAKLNSLIDKGISKELYDKLAEMGPKSYEQVNAFTQMTAEELAQANEYFATSLTMGDSQTAIIKESYDKVGVNVAQGAINGLNSKSGEMNAVASETGKEMTDSLAKGAGCQSPSILTFLTGQNIMYGLNNGLKAAFIYVQGTVRSIAQRIIAEFTDSLRPTAFYEIGKNAVYGLANGLADSDAAKQVMTNAETIAKAASEKMASALKEKSPSRVTMQIGEYATEGFAIGLMDAASNVYTAAQKVSEGAVDGLTDNGRLADALGEGIDLDPVITPVLDLSVIRAQMDEINAMFSTGHLSAGYAQNGGKFSANPDQPQQINFTQNNYSPKELSRIDIYRQTKNQISMMKGAIANA